MNSSCSGLHRNSAGITHRRSSSLRSARRLSHCCVQHIRSHRLPSAQLSGQHLRTTELQNAVVSNLSSQGEKSRLENVRAASGSHRCVWDRAGGRGMMESSVLTPPNLTCRAFTGLRNHLGKTETVRDEMRRYLTPETSLPLASF